MLCMKRLRNKEFCEFIRIFFVPNLTKSYIKHQEELLTVAPPNEQAIINTFLSLKKGGTVDFIPMSDTLFVWAKQWISENS